jgi:hypothetical protein
MGLTTKEIENAKPGSQPYKLADGGGLCLLISPTGARLSRWRYRFDGTEKMMALGEYPLVTLKEARERHFAARQKLAAGIDPMMERKAEAETRLREAEERQREAENSFEMIVAPGHNMVLPLMPEFISPQDGAEKQDCERNAVKRWLVVHGERVAGLRPVYLGDALFSCQPLAEAVLGSGADFLFVCKKDGHKTLYEFVEGASLDERTVTERRPGKHSLTYRYRWIEGVPLRDGKDALAVNWLAVSITDAKGKTTYDGAFVTSLPLTADNVIEVAACARARWKTREREFQRTEKQRL